MGGSKYIFTLNLHNKKSQVCLSATQADTDRELYIGFSDGGKPYVLDAGTVAMMSILRPTGVKIQEFCQIEDDGARVVYPFSQYTCSVAGLHTCEVVLINSKGKQIASPRFSIDAAPKLVDGNDVEIPDEDITAIDAIYQAEAQRQAAEAEREVAEAARQTNTTAAIKEINEVKTSIETMRDSGDFDGDDGFSPVVDIATTSDGYEVTITDKAGAKTFQLFNGANGTSAFHKWNGSVLTMHSAAGTSSADLKGDKGDKGDRGDGIDIVKTFSSVAEMMTGYATDGVPVGKFVVISTGNVDDEENARLYVKTETEYMYLTDLSGAQGIRGEKGDRGDHGKDGNDGESITVSSVVESNAARRFALGLRSDGSIGKTATLTGFAFGVSGKLLTVNGKEFNAAEGKWIYNHAVNSSTASAYSMIIYDKAFAGSFTANNYGVAIVLDASGKLTRIYDGANVGYYTENGKAATAGFTSSTYATVAFNDLVDGETLIIFPNDGGTNAARSFALGLRTDGSIGKIATLTGFTFGLDNKVISINGKSFEVVHGKWLYNTEVTSDNASSFSLLIYDRNYTGSFSTNGYGVATVFDANGVLTRIYDGANLGYYTAAGKADETHFSTSSFATVAFDELNAGETLLVFPNDGGYNVITFSDGTIVNIPSGRSPVKGADYFTPDDVKEMVQSVLDALPNGDEVSY